MEISLKINNENDLLNLTDLLLPLNYFNNFIHELQDLKILDRKFENERSIEMLNNEQFFRFPYSQTIRRSDSYVEVKKIKKESPVFLELLLNVAPYVEETIKLLLESEEADIESKLYKLLNKIDLLNNCSESKKRMIIKYILLFFKFLLRLITMSIKI